MFANRCGGGGGGGGCPNQTSLIILSFSPYEGGEGSQN